MNWRVKMIKLITAVTTILFSGCALTEAQDRYIERLSSVKVGDSYERMISKIEIKPHNVDCYKSRTYKSCSAVYNITAYDKVIFTFANGNNVTSIYF